MFGNNDKPKAPEANEMLLDAFNNTYLQVATEEEADEVFDYAKLRLFFGAMQIPKMPDPLPPYIDRLTEDMGFQFKMSWSGDPAIFVTRRNKDTRPHFCPSLSDDTEEIKELEDQREHLGDCSAWEDLLIIEKEEEETE